MAACVSSKEVMYVLVDADFFAAFLKESPSLLEILFADETFLSSDKASP